MTTALTISGGAANNKFISQGINVNLVNIIDQTSAITKYNNQYLVKVIDSKTIKLSVKYIPMSMGTGKYNTTTQEYQIDSQDLYDALVDGDIVTVGDKTKKQSLEMDTKYRIKKTTGKKIVLMSEDNKNRITMSASANDYPILLREFSMNSGIKSEICLKKGSKDSAYLVRRDNTICIPNSHLNNGDEVKLSNPTNLMLIPEVMRHLQLLH